MKDFIIGRNPVAEALKSGREINKILVAKGDREGSIKKIIKIARDEKIVLQEVDRHKLDQISEGESHQGVIAYIAAYEYADLKTVIDGIGDRDHQFVVVLDGINDPHNLGSIIRTGNASGVDAVVIPKRRAVGLTSTVAKTSVGAIEYVPVCRVVNIANTVEWLQSQGFWVSCVDMDGDRTFYEADFKGKVALVIGGEGTGVSKLVKEKCDFVVNIPMKGEVSSLNASVASAILMYEVMKQNEQA